MYAFLLIILSFVSQSSNSFSDELNNYIKKHLNGKIEDYSYEVLQMPKAYDKIELIETHDFNISGNMIYVPVKIFQKNSRVVESIISVKLKIFKSVLVAARDIKSHEPLADKDFYLKKVDIAQMNVSPISSLKEIKGLRSSGFIKAGEILSPAMTEHIPVIKANYPVTAKYINGNVVVTMSALSRQDGAVGEIITIITQDKKLYKARVIDPNDVIIIE